LCAESRNDRHRRRDLLVAFFQLVAGESQS
jgi:hypothetical protein